MNEQLFSLIYLAFVFVGLTWLVFFFIKMITKHTDIAQNKKKEKEKEDRLFNAPAESPTEGEALMNMFLGGNKPKIETSFGDKRIGAVHEHEKKN
tara:strand:- start:427 stop:711 length:285 start_codon:yes stop_codon:yes gene_type:complete